MPPFDSPPGFAAPTTTTAAAAAPAEATATPAGARRHRLGLVHGQVASAEAVVVQLLDRALGFFIGRHLDEAEAARTASCHVAHDFHALDRATLSKQLLEILLSRCVREVAHVKFSTHC